MSEEPNSAANEPSKLPQWRDFLAATAVLTRLPLERPSPHSAALARATLFFPLVGLLIGTVLAGLNWLLSAWVPRWIGAAIVVATWQALACSWSGALSAATMLTKLVCLGTAGSTRPAALLFAPLLARWTMVVLATGARDADTPGRKFNNAITFREFALSSVFSFAVVLAVADAFGIVIVVGVAAATLGLRLLSHRWMGGVSWRFLLASAQVIEALVVVLCSVF